MVVLRSRSPHLRAASLGDLHGQVPDATGGGVVQHAIARSNVQRVDDCLPGREASEWNRPCVNHGHAIGDSRDFSRASDRELRVCACGERELWHPEDPIAHIEPGYAWPDVGNNTGQVPSENQRYRRIRRLTLTGRWRVPALPIRWIDTTAAAIAETLIDANKPAPTATNPPAGS